MRTLRFGPTFDAVNGFTDGLGHLDGIDMFGPVGLESAFRSPIAWVNTIVVRLEIAIWIWRPRRGRVFPAGTGGISNKSNVSIWVILDDLRQEALVLGILVNVYVEARRVARNHKVGRFVLTTRPPPGPDKVVGTGGKGLASWIDQSKRQPSRTWIIQSLVIWITWQQSARVSSVRAVGFEHTGNVSILVLWGEEHHSVIRKLIACGDMSARIAGKIDLFSSAEPGLEHS